MAVIVDVVIAAVLIAGIVFGACRGLLKSVAGVVIVIVALFSAAWIAQHFADPVAEWLEPIIKEEITEKIEKKTTANASAGDMLSLFGFSGKGLTQMIETVTKRLYILSFLLLYILLKLLLKPLDLATKLPGLRALNGLGGAALGLIEAALLLYVAVWAMRKIQIIITPQLIEESMLLRIFTDYSPISLITSL